MGDSIRYFQIFRRNDNVHHPSLVCPFARIPTAGKLFASISELFAMPGFCRVNSSVGKEETTAVNSLSHSFPSFSHNCPTVFSKNVLSHAFPVGACLFLTQRWPAPRVPGEIDIHHIQDRPRRPTVNAAIVTYGGMVKVYLKIRYLKNLVVYHHLSHVSIYVSLYVFISFSYVSESKFLTCAKQVAPFFPTGVADGYFFRMILHTCNM